MLWGGRWKMWCVRLFHGCGMHKPHRVFMSLCRGVLHTPYKRPSEGGRGPCLWSWTGIRHPWDGALWGVCYTPLPCYPKNDRVRGMFCGGIRKTGCLLGMLWGGRWKMWCVYMSLCRGVLNTPYRRPIYGAKDPNDRSLIRILVLCGAIGWGVCHTPLP